MTKTKSDIITILRDASEAPLGRRTLAGMVRKSVKLFVELRADHTWEELSAVMRDIGYPVSAETLRRTIRRARPAQPAPPSPLLPTPPTLKETAAITPVPAPRPDALPRPHARDPPLPEPSKPGLSGSDDNPFTMGRTVLDKLSKLRDLNR